MVQSTAQRLGLHVPDGFKCCSHGYECLHPEGPVLPLTSENFTRNKQQKDGFRSFCKACQHRQHSNYVNNPERHDEIRERERQRQQTEPVRAYQREYVRKRRKQNPLKTKARFAVSEAVRTQKLPRVHTLKCSRCGNPAQEYHHHKGYEREFWLEVIPMCRKCHRLTETKTTSSSP